jgi:uncharacterized membrane protein YsdA (DUF1294 family)/cold shock CspA family protein
VQSPTRGKLVSWKADKAYGFIRPEDGRKDVFVHLRDFGRIARAPRVGDVVRFQKMSDGMGRVRAADVQVQGLDRHAIKPARPRELAPRPWQLFVALLAFATLAWLVAYRGLSIVVPGIFLVASLLVFLLYAFDKSAAMNRRWRMKESTLLLAGLLGGWPGALVAQGMFHHKSSKASFQLAFWLTVIANCVAIGWWSYR